MGETHEHGQAETSPHIHEHGTDRGPERPPCPDYTSDIEREAESEPMEKRAGADRKAVRHVERD